MVLTLCYADSIKLGNPLGGFLFVTDLLSHFKRVFFFFNQQAQCILPPFLCVYGMSPCVGLTYHEQFCRHQTGMSLYLGLTYHGRFCRRQTGMSPCVGLTYHGQFCRIQTGMSPSGPPFGSHCSDNLSCHYASPSSVSPRVFLQLLVSC